MAPPISLMNEMKWLPQSRSSIGSRPRTLIDVHQRLSAHPIPPGTPDFEFASDDVNTFTLQQKASAFEWLLDCSERCIKEVEGRASAWIMEERVHDSFINNKTQRMAVIPAYMRLFEGAVRVISHLKVTNSNLF